METPRGNLSQIMRHINGAYTTFYNVRHRRSGHLFQGRYIAILVEADAYAGELSRYVHLNPVRAGIVEMPEKYKWSSYPCYIGSKEKPEWLAVDFILEYFKGNGMSSFARYRDFVMSKVGNDDSPLEGTVASTILGSDNFIEKIHENFIKGREKNRDLPALSKLSSSPDINEIYNSIKSVIRDDLSFSRNYAIYLCRNFSGKTLKEIGKYFGISEAAVSQTNYRFCHKLAKDKKLKKRIDELLRKITLFKV